MRHNSTSIPPNPSLVAILLVTRSRTGPRLVFHYPAIPTANTYSTKRDPSWYGTPGTATEDSAASSDDWDSSSSESTAAGDSGDDDDTSSRAGSGTGSRGSKVRSGKTKSTRDGLSGHEVDEETIESNERGDGDGNAKDDLKKKEQYEIEWERLLGFSADGLSHLLSPSKAFNKRKFEVGIEQYVFLGAPMFQRDDGYWKKRKRHRKKESVDVTNSPRSTEVDKSDHKDMPGDVSNFEPKLSTSTDADLFRVPGFDAAYGHGLVSGAASEFESDTRSTSTAADEREMIMFNIVFVMNPLPQEHHLRIDEMYDFVVKRFAKVLKVEQAQSNYVAAESRVINAMKEKGRENKAPIATLWPNIIATSSLARSISIIFDTISANKIAHIELNGFDMSFQIPQAISTPFAPTATEPQMPGLWLTTATLMDDEDLESSLSPHAALLLLEDEDTLLKEVMSDGKELGGPLSFFIRNLTPTKSLLKLSQRHSMPLKDVQFLARHLIYWRRARAIPPLHYRDTYVVSPNADMRALAAAVPAFAARFPTLPPLIKILQLLSGPPKQYRMLMPSPDHRTAYMEILAWLMRGGWVTQLRTFAWIRVSREVKAAVAAKQNREFRNSIVTNPVIESLSDEGRDHTHARENSQTSSMYYPQIQRSPEGRSAAEAGNSHTSPLLSPFRYPAGPPSDAGSTSSSRTAMQSNVSALSPIPRPESRTFHRPSPLHINQSASPSSAEDTPTSPVTAHRATSSRGDGENMHTLESAITKSEDPKDYEPSLVHSPQRATNEESAWIEYIGAQVAELFKNDSATVNGASQEPGPEPKDLWPQLLKYFDGRYALEEISAREGFKKKKVREFLGRLVREGILITVRHW
ncbi:uncharacterized protein PV09_02534 [Verruconis gallopava]|uniref:Nitrogen permease regulator 3 n=1 Tax=Verruconis gallopava TaxID=253628 RepID=A0A0D2AIX0_9PEZI|nr:uncharacterized protein PV09_02534 [Verruconis gallopava]KIW06858.1 hypothetical protein PV09_02534 [Verruconis gallopava]